MRITTTTTGLERANKAIGRIHRQFRYAARLAVNDVAFEIKKAHPRYAESVFDQPVALTKRAPKIETAKHSRDWNQIAATIYLQDHVAGGTAPGKYLRAQWRDTKRQDKASEVRLRQTIQYTKKHGAQIVLPPGWQMIPAREYRNSRGNITKGMMQKILADLKGFHDPMQNRSESQRKRFFVINPMFALRGLPPGVYERKGKRKKLVLMFVPTAQINYTKHPYQFEKWVQKQAIRKMPLRFKARLRKAMDTAYL